MADRWRYHVRWKHMAEPGGLLAGAWLVIAPPGQPGAECAARCADGLAGRGADVDVVTADPVADRQELAALLGGAADLGRLSGVVSLLALARQPCPGLPWLTAGTAGTLALIQALDDIQCRARLWLVTKQAVGTGDTDLAADPGQAQIWGLGRVAGLEHPDRWGGLADLPTVPNDRAWARLASVLADGSEDQVAIRPAGVFARRLVRAPARVTSSPRHWRPRGTIMITGGTASFGRRLARWLAAAGAPRLLLTQPEPVNKSASTAADSTAADSVALAAELAALGTHATIATCDITDRGGLARALAAIPASHPLTAVFHTAGTLGEGVLSAMSLPGFAGVLAEKAGGAANLHDVLAGRPLDAFVLFSSISATWGSYGQAGYAAANAYLDAIAEQRRSAGQAATSIAWGPWDDVALGDRVQDEARRDQLRRRGLGDMPSEAALAVLRQALDNDETAMVVAEVDWERFLPVFRSVRPWPFFNDLPEMRGTAAPEGDAGQAGARQALARKLAGRTQDDRARLIESMVLQHVSAVLRLPSSADLVPRRSFRELGFESVSAVDLRNRLTEATGLPLPATLVFDHPTPEALVEYLHAELGRDSATVPAGELDRLESYIADGAFSDRERPVVAARLRALLARLDDSRQSVQTATLAEKVQTASDDEMFALIDAELDTT